MPDLPLVAWANRYCRQGAAAVRAASNPTERAELLQRLDRLWWSWGARLWASWTRDERETFDADVAHLVAEGLDLREATRAVLERRHPGSWPGTASDLANPGSATGAAGAPGKTDPGSPAAAPASPLTVGA